MINKKGVAPVIMVSIIAAVVLIGGGLVWYFISQNDSDDINSNTSNTNSIVVNTNTTLNLNTNNTVNTNSSLNSNGNTNQVVNTNVNQPTTDSNIDTQDNPLYSAGTTVQINEYMSPICSSYGDNCDQIKITLDVDLTEDSNGDKLTGKFYARAFLGDEKVGETQITQNYNPFCGDGGQPCVEDQERILTLDYPFQSNFYLTYQQSVPSFLEPGYILTLNNTPVQSSYSDRLVDFYYENDIVNISFPQ